MGLARPGLDGGGCHGGLSSERREPATDRTWIARPGKKRTPHLAFSQVRGSLRVVRDTGIEPVTSSVSGKRSPAELIAPGDGTVRGGDGNRTRVQGFAGPCLSHSATPPASPRSTLRADDGIRTRDPNLGKVVRYQLRYIRTRCPPLVLASACAGRNPNRGAGPQPNRVRTCLRVVLAGGVVRAVPRSTGSDSRPGATGAHGRPDGETTDQQPSGKHPANADGGTASSRVLLEGHQQVDRRLDRRWTTVGADTSPGRVMPGV